MVFDLRITKEWPDSKVLVKIQTQNLSVVVLEVCIDTENLWILFVEAQIHQDLETVVKGSVPNSHRIIIWAAQKQVFGRLFPFRELKTRDILKMSAQFPNVLWGLAAGIRVHQIDNCLLAADSQLVLSTSLNLRI